MSASESCQTYLPLFGATNTLKIFSNLPVLETEPRTAVIHHFEQTVLLLSWPRMPTNTPPFRCPLWLAVRCIAAIPYPLDSMLPVQAPGSTRGAMQQRKIRLKQPDWSWTYPAQWGNWYFCQEFLMWCHLSFWRLEINQETAATPPGFGSHQELPPAKWKTRTCQRRIVGHKIMLVAQGFLHKHFGLLQQGVSYSTEEDPTARAFYSYP